MLSSLASQVGKFPSVFYAIFQSSPVWEPPLAHCGAMLILIYVSFSLPSHFSILLTMLPEIDQPRFKSQLHNVVAVWLGNLPRLSEPPFSFRQNENNNSSSARLYAVSSHLWSKGLLGPTISTQGFCLFAQRGRRQMKCSAHRKLEVLGELRI